MKCNVQKIDECRVKLTIEAEPEAVDPYYQEELKKFQKAAKIPGFRDGKAPIEMIEKKYAPQIEEEALKFAIPALYHQAVVQQTIAAVSAPAIKDIRYQRGQRLTFCAEVDKAPEIKLKNYKGIRISRPSEEVTPADVDKAIQALLDSRAEFDQIAEVRPVQKGDYIVADVEMWRDGQYTPGKKNALLYVDANANDDFYEKVIGTRVDDVREITLKQGSPQDSEMALRPQYKIWIRAIQQKKLPVLDDVFARVFGQEGVGQLKEYVRKDIASYKRNESMENMKAQLFDRLLDSHHFSVPQSLCEKQFERLMEQAKRQYLRMGVKEEEFEKKKAELEPEAKKKAAEQVRLYFILHQVAELESIVPDETELNSKLQALVEESKRPEDEVRQVFEDDLRESLAEKKTIEFLIANANLADETTAVNTQENRQ